MAQKMQQLQSGTGEKACNRAWLPHLVATFETLSSQNFPCAPLGAGEIGASDMAALMSQLSGRSHALAR